jgi:carboxyl-terminal processing protease
VLVAVLAFLLPVVLGVGIYLGGHSSLLPDVVRDAFVDSAEEEVLDEAMDLIEDDYYRNVPRDELVNSSIQGMVDDLDDRFSQYFDPEQYRRFQEATTGEFSGIGVSVGERERGLLVSEVFRGSPAQAAGIRVGDLIVGVNGESIAGKPSRYSTALIRGEPGTKVRLTIQRKGRRLQKDVERAAINVPVVDNAVRTVNGRKLGIVTLSSFTEGAHAAVREAVDQDLKRGAQGIVLDLRNNGGGLLDESVLVASIFIEDGTIVTTEGRSRGRRVFTATGGAISPSVPLTVLVDRGTASASEIVAGAIQDRGRGEVVGTHTFGKGVFQQVEQLSNGGALDLTVGEYFLPSGRNIGGGGPKQGDGLKPDVRALDDPDTPRRDEALDQALEVVGKQ